MCSCLLLPRLSAPFEAGRLAQDRGERQVSLFDPDAKMKCYVAGRIRNDPLYFEKFAKAAEQLRQQGYCVFNPAAANLEKVPLNRIMAYLLPQLCECDAIALQRGWWRSGGARIEWMLARYIGLKVIWL